MLAVTKAMERRSGDVNVLARTLKIDERLNEAKCLFRTSYVHGPHLPFSSASFVNSSRCPRVACLVPPRAKSISHKSGKEMIQSKDENERRKKENEHSPARRTEMHRCANGGVNYGR